MTKWRRFIKSNKDTARPPKPDLETRLAEASRLLERDDTEAALELLEPLAAANPRAVDVQVVFAQALTQDGDPRAALAVLERTHKLTRDPRLWGALGWTYDILDMPAHALYAFQQIPLRDLPPPFAAETTAQIAELTEIIQAEADALNLPLARTSEGLRELEMGALHLVDADYPAVIAANRRGIRILGDFLPALNNLTLALFLAGKPQEAQAEARRVLEQHPADVHALHNAVRILAWTGAPDEARRLWEEAGTIVPADADDALTLAMAAGVLDDDAAVIRLLQPQDRPKALEILSDTARARFQIFLAIAEANLGQTKKAKKRLRTPAEEGHPQAEAILAALATGKTSVGFTGRFSYYVSIELVSLAVVEEVIGLFEKGERMSERRFRKEVDGLVARYPQLVLMAEKQIWDEGSVEAGIELLELLNTPAAHAALLRFATSQAGEVDQRFRALQVLVDVGAVSQKEAIPFWTHGEWRGVQSRPIMVVDEPEVIYSESVAQLLNDGIAAFNSGRTDEAERLFAAAIREEPRAKEAYNNLGKIYIERGDVPRARSMYEAAIEADPFYVFPRVNIALLRLADDDVDGAEDSLRPLADKQRFLPNELAFYQFGMARVEVAREHYADARRLLTGCMAVDPDFAPAYELSEQLNELEMLSKFRVGIADLVEGQRRRDLASRARQQAKLTTSTPTVAEVLGLYNVETLKAMARVVAPQQERANATRKAQIFELLVAELHDAANVHRIIADNLDDVERAALRVVLAAGGALPRQEFVARYGDDEDESLHWQHFPPDTTLGRLRYHGLLAETTVDGVVLVVVPADLRPVLTSALD